MLNLTLLYRGPLRDCNFDCWYCPFGKQRASSADIETDARALARFSDWVASRRRTRLAVFFTPWGEALIRPSYQQATATLTRVPHVTKVAVQTNLSCSLDWIDRCDTRQLGLWCTYHPRQITLDRFAARCRRLDQLGVRYSVGVVGLSEHYDDARRLRQMLREDVYLWVNAYKEVLDYYLPEDRQRWEAIDPLFPISTRRHASRGETCRCGHTVLTVDGEGTIQRCHFIDRPLGNIYQPGFEHSLAPRPCTNQTCGCHIGYVHLCKLRLDEIFGEGILERVPRARARGASLCPPSR